MGRSGKEISSSLTQDDSNAGRDMRAKESSLIISFPLFPAAIFNILVFLFGNEVEFQEKSQVKIILKMSLKYFKKETYPSFSNEICATVMLCSAYKFSVQMLLFK